MYITECYKYKLNKIVYVGGTLPDKATILETMNILNAEDGFDLVKDGENLGSSVWLKDGDVQENYTEVEKVDS